MRSGKADDKVFGVGEDWRFDHAPTIVERGWAEWKRSGRMPTYEEVAARSIEWEGDIFLFDDLVKWANNDTTQMPTPSKDGTRRESPYFNRGQPK